MYAQASYVKSKENKCVKNVPLLSAHDNVIISLQDANEHAGIANNTKLPAESCFIRYRL